MRLGDEASLFSFVRINCDAATTHLGWSDTLCLEQRSEWLGVHDADNVDVCQDRSWQEKARFITLEVGELSSRPDFDLHIVFQLCTSSCAEAYNLTGISETRRSSWTPPWGKLAKSPAPGFGSTRILLSEWSWSSWGSRKLHLAA